MREASLSFCPTCIKIGIYQSSIIIIYLRIHLEKQWGTAKPKAPTHVEKEPTRNMARRSLANPQPIINKIIESKETGSAWIKNLTTHRNINIKWNTATPRSFTQGITNLWLWRVRNKPNKTMNVLSVVSWHCGCRWNWKWRMRFWTNSLR